MEYEHTTPEGKKYNLDIDPISGDEIRYYEPTEHSSGAIYNYTQKKIVSSGALFTSETGKAARQIQEDQKVQAVHDAIMGIPGADMDLVKGLTLLAAQRVVVAMGSGTESNKAFELVMKHGKFIEPEGTKGLSVTLDKETATGLLKMIFSLKAEEQGDIIDVTPTDRGMGE